MLKGLKKKKIKIMSNKMSISIYLSTIESKNKLSKQNEQGQNHGYESQFDFSQMGRGNGGLSEEVMGLRSTTR